MQKNTIKRKLLEALAWTKNDEMEVDYFFFIFEFNMKIAVTR